MNVIKRDGSCEPVSISKMAERLRRLCDDVEPRLARSEVDPERLSREVLIGAYDGVPTARLDGLAAETAAYFARHEISYAVVAARITVSHLHKHTEASFVAVARRLHAHRDERGRLAAQLFGDEAMAFVERHAAALDAAIVHERDYRYTYFGLSTLKRSYLTRIDDIIIERPQHLIMRVAVGIHAVGLARGSFGPTSDIAKSEAREARALAAVLDSYRLMSCLIFTHATPTLFNAAAPRPQLASCFLLAMREDSIDGIYDTLKQCAVISKSAGGIGLAIHKVRAKGAYVAGTNGTSNGIVPMLRNYNDTARYVDQGGGKRKGAFAIYLEPWHADIFDFLVLRRNNGKEEERTRDLFLGLWVPDLFMRRVAEGGTWTLFCPSEAPGLYECWGAEFEAKYEQYEREGRGRRTIEAQELWFAIIDAQIETGMPYMLYKDACNAQSNHRHLGTIQSSNLCTEVVQFTSRDEIAVCTLGSIALPMFIIDADNGAAGRSLSGRGLAFDHVALHDVVQVLVRNLDTVIDVNHYPVPEAANSSLRHRPIGIGVQGLADVFMRLGLAWDDPAARELNRDIFETIHHAALTASCERARELGTYPTYDGSPASQGELQCDMWRDEHGGPVRTSGRWDWAQLRVNIAEHGLRNSLLTAPMPTATTAQILGNSEGFDPLTSNVFVRRTLAGDYIVVNEHLVRDLTARGLWNRSMYDEIVAASGSVQGIATVPGDIKRIYRTVWELPQRVIVDMSADRGPYIDQSQSLNIYMSETAPADIGGKLAAPIVARMTSMHFYGWRRKLKTGMYYLRTRPAAVATKFTVDLDLLRRVESGAVAAPAELAQTDAASAATKKPFGAAASVESDEVQACYIGCESCSA